MAPPRSIESPLGGSPNRGRAGSSRCPLPTGQGSKAAETLKGSGCSQASRIHAAVAMIFPWSFILKWPLCLVTGMPICIPCGRCFHMCNWVWMHDFLGVWVTSHYFLKLKGEFRCMSLRTEQPTQPTAPSSLWVFQAISVFCDAGFVSWIAGIRHEGWGDVQGWASTLGRCLGEEVEWEFEKGRGNRAGGPLILYLLYDVISSTQGWGWSSVVVQLSDRCTRSSTTRQTNPWPSTWASSVVFSSCLP